MLGRGVTTITSGSALARQAAHALGSRGLDNPRDGEGDYWFLCTGDAQAFRALGTRFLQMPLGEVAQVRLGEGDGADAATALAGQPAAIAGRPQAGAS
jgi:glutamate racemase